MRHIIITLLLVAFWISGCKEQEKPKIFQIEDATEVRIDSVTGEYQRRKEYFVIANPPEDTLALRTLVDAYNDSTLTDAEIKKYYSYWRWFYSEHYDDYEPFDSTRYPEKFNYFMKSDDGWTKKILRVEWRYHKGSKMIKTYTFYRWNDWDSYLEEISSIWIETNE